MGRFKAFSTYIFLVLYPQSVLGRRSHGHLHLSHGSIIDDRTRRSLADTASPQKPNGDAACPCLSREDLNGNDLKDGAPRVNATAYGVGCAPHDIGTPACSDTPECTSVVPLPTDCDRSWCQRSWCYVDPNKCDRLHSRSVRTDNRYYSYATCGMMDSFTYAERRKALRGKTFRAGFNSNSGGWMGAYNSDGSFAVNDKWRGPIVTFIKAAAREGGFSINITRPPEWLRVESQRFYGSSIFDYCVYATTLGYLDFCVAAYTISDKRAATTTFFETTDDPMFLVTFADGGGTSWDSFSTAFLTVFQPFTTGAWLMIILFVLPTFGLLMIVHEYGAPGSAYPRTVQVLDSKSDRNVVKTKRVPMRKHIVRGIYMSFLAFFQECYNKSVVTLGGKINLLGISSFILLVVAVYTANLAAILTQDIHKRPVSSIDDAIKAGYTFCAERKVMELIMQQYELDEGQVVPDPIEEGGDGLPGFNCGTCAARRRVFDFMKRDNTDKSKYCDAALASWEDVQVLHALGHHCNKTRVGEVLAYQNIGIPIYDQVADELISLLHEMKNQGMMSKEIAAAYPESHCPETEGEGSALTIEQLTGIWMISFSFAAAALVVKWMHGPKCLLSKVMHTESAAKKDKALERYDQWGNPTAHDVVIEKERDFYRFERRDSALQLTEKPEEPEKKRPKSSRNFRSTGHAKSQRVGRRKSFGGFAVSFGDMQLDETSNGTEEEQRHPSLLDDTEEQRHPSLLDDMEEQPHPSLLDAAVDIKSNIEIARGA